MESCKIYITGMGAVTPIGIGVSQYWNGLLNGRCGIDDLSDIDLPIIPRAARIKEFHARDYFPMHLVQDLAPYMQYAFAAAEGAVTGSRLQTDSERIGIVMGTALGGITEIENTASRFALTAKTAGPKFLTKAMGNITAAQFAIYHKILGPCMTVSTACSSGGDAVSLAAMMIRSGMADAMIVMAGEAAITPTVVQSLLKTGALSKTGDSKPFDLYRNGFVLGEGGGALVLENEAHMTRRGAIPLAELIGYANNTDAFNPVSPEPEGIGAAKCMENALHCAGITPDQIDYINAHGTATAAGDAAEAKAILRVFGNRAVPVSSTKGATGHMMGAGGITEIIACVKAIHEGVMPENIGYSQPDPACGLNIVTKKNCRGSILTAMSNAFGFGGQNSCIIVKKAD